MTTAEIASLAGALATIVSIAFTTWRNYVHSRAQHGATGEVKS